MGADLGLVLSPAGERLRSLHPPDVHRPEGRSREGGEDLGVRLHRIGDSLAAPKPGGHEMEGVPPVPARAGTAPSSTTSPAGDEQHVVGLPVSRVNRADFSRHTIHLLDLAPQPDRTAAVAGMGYLLLPGREAVPGPLHRLQEDRRVGTVTEGPEVRQAVGPRVLSRHTGGPAPPNG